MSPAGFISAEPIGSRLLKGLSVPLDRLHRSPLAPERIHAFSLSEFMTDGGGGVPDRLTNICAAANERQKRAAAHLGLQRRVQRLAKWAQ